MSFIQASVVVMLALSSMFVSRQYALSKVAFNRKACKIKVIYRSIVENAVTRGLQNLNPVFS